MDFGLQEENPNLPVYIVPGTYIWIWIEETIAYSNLQDIFQRRKIILAHFGLWQGPNKICPVPQVYFVRVLTYVWIEKTIAYLNLQHTFQMKKKSFLC